MALTRPRIDSPPCGRLWHLNRADRRRLHRTDAGPHGHQGLITVVVADKEWECTATFKGTDSSTANSVKNGTASEPKCSKVG